MKPALRESLLTCLIKALSAWTKRISGRELMMSTHFIGLIHPPGIKVICTLLSSWSLFSKVNSINLHSFVFPPEINVKHCCQFYKCALQQEHLLTCLIKALSAWTKRISGRELMMSTHFIGLIHPPGIKVICTLLSSWSLFSKVNSINLHSFVFPPEINVKHCCQFYKCALQQEHL